MECTAASRYEAWENTWQIPCVSSRATITAHKRRRFLRSGRWPEGCWANVWADKGGITSNKRKGTRHDEAIEKAHKENGLASDRLAPGAPRLHKHWDTSTRRRNVSKTWRQHSTPARLFLFFCLGLDLPLLHEALTFIDSTCRTLDNLGTDPQGGCEVASVKETKIPTTGSSTSSTFTCAALVPYNGQKYSLREWPTTSGFTYPSPTISCWVVPSAVESEA
jgi:hypothetical protein